jgi:RNA polymerase sigma-70 factor (ECF subfamily)
LTNAKTAPSDDILLMKIAGGNRPALRSLFVRHRVPVYRWLLRIVGDASLAEDLTSDVFLDVWCHAGRFEGRSTVATWLLAIARYKALSALRRRPDHELDEQSAAKLLDAADDPEIVLQKKDRAERVRGALAILSQEHREVIDLVYFHGKTAKEVGEILCIPVATVKTRMYYARKKLSQLIDSGDANGAARRDCGRRASWNYKCRYSIH